MMKFIVYREALYQFRRLSEYADKNDMPNTKKVADDLYEYFFKKVTGRS